ncbi:hypothetical protein QZH41_005072 [Actinostola sp. cb2023]|nr:hypothetical protein QZH41_005072 [Actinostola sp. cb2023]
MNNTTRSYGPSLEPVYQAILGLLVLESVIIILTNSLVFVLVAKYKKLRRKTNYCLISLATSDLLAGVLIVPLMVACNSLSPPDDADVCAAMDISQRFLSISTILHVCLATGERYFKIRFPLRYKYCITGKRIVVALLSVWGVSLATSLVELAFMGDKEQEYIYCITCMTILACVPFLIIVAVNIHTKWIINRGNKARQMLVRNAANDKRKEKQRRAVLVYLAMAVSFMVGWLPYFTLPVINLRIDLPVWLGATFILLKFCTSFVNPLLYTFFKTDFNNALKDMTSREHTPSYRLAAAETRQTNV